MKLTVPKLLEISSQRNLAVVTAYDYTMAKLLDPHVDIVLVGDSLGMVVQGHENTLPVTIEQMIYHAQNVHRALQHAHLVVDLPFMSYQTSTEQALTNAARLVKEGFAEAVKLEGGKNFSSTIEKMVHSGIPVMGHLGLTPQSFHTMGGYKIQGRTEESQKQLFEDAKILEQSGCYSIVLEGIPSPLAKKITESLKIPTIGIGAGPSCKGQVLVISDLLGMNVDFKPKFVKSYLNLSKDITEAIKNYTNEIIEGKFPADEHSF
jgi:3-methyl-2-oxobutanoate hydroxymethyltransferase